MQVAVIGVGHVGASVAVALLQTGAARELLLHDHDHARAEGEAMDLAHGVPYYPRARVRAVTLDEAVCADVVVFAAGRNGRPGGCNCWPTTFAWPARSAAGWPAARPWWWWCPTRWTC